VRGDIKRLLRTNSIRARAMRRRRVLARRSWLFTVFRAIP
jgi:hypothetical protein